MARFNLKVHIAPGANPGADPATWVWVDVTAKVRYPGQDGGQPITITAGRQDEASRVDASAMTLTFDNRGGEFSTRNPLSPYYGALHRNTPIRVGQGLITDTFTRTASNGWGTSDDGRVWTMPNGAWPGFSVSGGVALGTFPTANDADTLVVSGSHTADVDGYFTCSTPVVATGGPFIFCGLARYESANNYYLFRCELSTGGSISAKISKVVAGVATQIAVVEPLSITYTANERIRVRYQADGPALRLKIWKEASAEPDAWTVTVNDPDLAYGRIGMVLWRFATNTNPGAVAMAVDDYTAQSVEYVGTVVQWPVRWTKRGNGCWAPIQAAGVLRRLQQGTGALKSALARQLPAYNPTGYWALEDGAGATTFANVLTNGRPASFVGVSPASDSSLAGASVTPTLNDPAGRITGSAPRSSGGTGFSAMFFSKLSSVPATRTILATFTGTGRVVRWVVSLDTTVFVEGYDAAQNLVVNNATAFPLITTTQWVAWQLETEVVGANTNWALALHQVGLATYYAASGSYASSAVSSVTGWTLGGGTELNGAAFSHMWVGANTLPFVADSFSLVSAGYAGELASDRIARLCAEEGIRVTVEAGDSVALGPQRQSTIIDALQSAADADYGILYERGAGLGFRPHGARYSQPVLLALSVASRHLSDAPEPVDDDQRVRNFWTVGRDGGSSATVYDQDHIDEQGLYDDSTTLNVASDDMLASHAGWRVYLGTRPELRWPGISLNFARTPALLTTWRCKSYGPRMTVTTGMAQVAGSDPDVIIEGFTQTLSPDSWTADLRCSSAKPWDVVALDGGLRLDTDGCELAEDLDTTETAVDVLTTSGPPWAPTSLLPAEVPFAITVGGEDMTVTNVAGTGAAQTLTVTRSVNGIVKTHTTAAPVALRNPTFLAL